MASTAPSSNLPAVDARLVAPESRYEIEEGRIQYVAPADEPHATRHSKVDILVGTHVHPEYEVACDMLTRTSETDDMAPDVSVFPRARHAETGGRQLEELAFEVTSIESLSAAERKARKLVERGVRRVFAVDVERQRAFEWSRDTGGWGLLARDSVIEDRALAAPLSVSALVEAVNVDDAVAVALLAKRNATLQAALVEQRALGKAEAVLSVLSARNLLVNRAVRQRILAERELAILELWLARAVVVPSAEGLFDV